MKVAVVGGMPSAVDHIGPLFSAVVNATGGGMPYSDRLSRGGAGAIG